MFNYDWFHGQGFAAQKVDARTRCTRKHFSDLSGPVDEWTDEARKFHDELETRTLIYLRDGFSYEVADLSEVETRSDLVFECAPVDDQYKVGSFVVTVPFEEVVRVEVFAVHPSVKPEDAPQITGFRSPGEPPEHGPPGR